LFQLLFYLPTGFKAVASNLTVPAQEMGVANEVLINIII